MTEMEDLAKFAREHGLRVGDSINIGGTIYDVVELGPRVAKFKAWPLPRYFCHPIRAAIIRLQCRIFPGRFCWWLTEKDRMRARSLP